MESGKRSGLRNVLIFLFAVAMLMGTGPGVLLVNRPASVFGIPLVYAWGLLWYFVLVLIAVAAYAFLWKSDERSEESDSK
jgi:hypothetical protein